MQHSSIIYVENAMVHGRLATVSVCIDFEELENRMLSGISSATAPYVCRIMWDAPEEIKDMACDTRHVECDNGYDAAQNAISEFTDTIGWLWDGEKKTWSEDIDMAADRLEEEAVAVSEARKEQIGAEEVASNIANHFSSLPNNSSSNSNLPLHEGAGFHILRAMENRSTSGVFACKVCGRDIGWDAPSGVCSCECLMEGQGLTLPEKVDHDCNRIMWPSGATL